jgi:hypothetical protein
MRVEFNPPSDFSADPSSGSKKKIWVFLGVGCGAMLLVVGLLFAVGAFRAVSCCTDLADVGKRTITAQLTAQEVSLALHQGEYETAYRYVSSSLRAELSPQQFREVFRPHEELLQSGYPLLADMQTRGESLEELRDITAWTAVVRFIPPTGQEVLVVDLGLQWRGEEADPAVELVSVHVDRRVRPLEEEPAARSVQVFLRTLRQGEWEEARRQLSPDSPLRQGELDGFRSFVRDHGEVLTGDRPRIESVAYGPLEANVVVVQGSVAMTFLLESSGGHWRILTIERSSRRPDESGQEQVAPVEDDSSPESLED